MKLIIEVHIDTNNRMTVDGTSYPVKTVVMSNMPNRIFIHDEDIVTYVATMLREHEKYVES